MEMIIDSTIYLWYKATKKLTKLPKMFTLVLTHRQTKGICAEIGSNTSPSLSQWYLPFSIIFSNGVGEIL